MRILSVILVILFPTSFLASGVYEEWVSVYSGEENTLDKVSNVVLDSQGNVYVVGYSYTGEIDHDICLVKYDNDGNEEWVATYDYEHDIATSLTIDNDDNVIVGGYSFVDIFTSSYTTIKYDNEGNELWSANYGSSGCEIYDICVDDSGNVYVTGEVAGSGGYKDYGTVKYDSEGNELWAVTYDGPDGLEDKAFAICVDGEGNVYVTGESNTETKKKDYCTVKYDSGGNEIWVARYNGPGNDDDSANCISLDSAGNVYVSGYSIGYGTKKDFCTIRYDSNGNEVWISRYNGLGEDDEVVDMWVNGESNVYVTGYSQGDATGYDYCTIKYTTNGHQLWVARYDGPSRDNDKPYSMFMDANGDIYVTGESKGDGTDYDYCTIKYDNGGMEMWNIRYDNGISDKDKAQDIWVDEYGYVYVAGHSDNEGGNCDFLTIKYKEVQGDIELVSFYAEEAENRINLRWMVDISTDTELEGFNLYRRDVRGAELTSAKSMLRIGEMNWRRINDTLITGANPYSYTDSNVIENRQYEYRLEAVLTDDESEILGTTTATSGSGAPGSFSIVNIYPNPCVDTLNCVMAVPEAGNIEMAIYDISGRRVAEKEITVESSGEVEVELDVKNISSGVYSVVVRYNGVSSNVRVVIER